MGRITTCPLRATGLSWMACRPRMPLCGGLMIGVEIVKDQKTREYGASERDRIVEHAFEQGVLFLGCGPSTIRIAPPLIVTIDEADVAVDVLEESIAAVEKNA